MKIDTFLATHYLSEDGVFVPYPVVTSGNGVDALGEVLSGVDRDPNNGRWKPREWDTDGAALAAWITCKWECGL